MNFTAMATKHELKLESEIRKSFFLFKCRDIESTVILTKHLLLHSSHSSSRTIFVCSLFCQFLHIIFNCSIPFYLLIKQLQKPHLIPWICWYTEHARKLNMAVCCLFYLYQIKNVNKANRKADEYLMSEKIITGYVFCIMRLKISCLPVTDKFHCQFLLFHI